MKQLMKRIDSLFRKILATIPSHARKPTNLPSETSKCRERLAKYCIGCGLDIGFGGDPIVDHAIRVDLPQPYRKEENISVQLAGDARSLFWFKSSTLDFIYSSHLLEDFDNVEEVLSEWLRVLKPGGKLILFCPDEQVYRAYCNATGHPYNQKHKIENFSLKYVKAILGHINQTQIIHENALVDVYSWELVCVKH